jgi:hypothetical protein
MSRSGTWRRSDGADGLSRGRDLKVHEGAGIPTRSSKRWTRPSARPAHEDAPYLRIRRLAPGTVRRVEQPRDVDLPASHAARERPEPADPSLSE